MVVALLVLLLGPALVLVAHDHEAWAMRGSPEGCVFDQSCDVTPGVVAARRVAQVGWSVAGAGAVLVGVALASAAGRHRPVRPAVTGVTLVVSGVAGRALLLGGSVPPPTFGCRVSATCAADPGWARDTPFYDLVLVLPLLGSVFLVIALLRLLGSGRPTRRPAQPAAPFS